MGSNKYIPDDYQFAGKTMQMIEIPIINIEKCQGCGLCVSICKSGSIVLIDKKATIIEMPDCDWCTLCEAVCPNGAITCPFRIIKEEK